MSYIKRFLYHTFTYAVCITLAFYIFAEILSLPDKTIGIGRFMLLLAFASVIALSEFIFEIRRFNKIAKYAVHFTSLFIIFFVMFLNVRLENGSGFSVPFLFTALFIFTVFYCITAFLVHFVKKRTSAYDN